MNRFQSSFDIRPYSIAIAQCHDDRTTRLPERPAHGCAVGTPTRQSASYDATPHWRRQDRHSRPFAQELACHRPPDLGPHPLRRAPRHLHHHRLRPHQRRRKSHPRRRRPPRSIQAQDIELKYNSYAVLALPLMRASREITSRAFSFSSAARTESCASLLRSRTSFDLEIPKRRTPRSAI